MRAMSYWNILVVILLTVVIGGPVNAQAPDDLASLNAQVVGLYSQGKYSEATSIAIQALALAESKSGPDHPDVGTSLNNLAALYRVQGRIAEAEPLYYRALAIREKTLGPDHPEVGESLNNLALFYVKQGRYTEAEPIYKRSLTIFLKAFGPRHSSVGTSLNNLAELYRDQGRHVEAEALYNRALAIREQTLGFNHPSVGQSLNNLALLYRMQGRTTEAEPLYYRALAIREKTLGPDHPDVGQSLHNLAALYQDQRRYVEAEPLYNRALAIREKMLGPDHPEVGNVLNGLAELYRAQMRFAEAELLYKRSLAISEKALGPDHSDVGRSLNNLALLYDDQGRYAEAEPIYERSLAISVKALGPDHPHVGITLDNLAGLHLAQRNWIRAGDGWRRSTGLIVRRAQRGANGGGETLTGKAPSEAVQLSHRFFGLVKAVHRIAMGRRSTDTVLLDAHFQGDAREMFETAQWASASEAAKSLAQMAARGSKGDLVLSSLVRERQDLVAEWQKREAMRIVVLGQAPDKRDPSAETAYNARSNEIDTLIAAIDTQLQADFPDYAALSSPQSLSVEQVQADLTSDEALVLFLDTPAQKATPEETFIWVVTKKVMRWVKSELGTPALTREVAALRCGLDATAWHGDGAKRCVDLLKLAPDKLPLPDTLLPVRPRPGTQAFYCAVRRRGGSYQGQAPVAGAVGSANAAAIPGARDEARSNRLVCRSHAG